MERYTHVLVWAFYSEEGPCKNMFLHADYPCFPDMRTFDHMERLMFDSVVEHVHLVPLKKFPQTLLFEESPPF